MRYPREYYDCSKLQDKIMQTLDAVAPKDLSNHAKGYVALEAMKLRIRMKGPPKAVDAPVVAKSRRSIASAPIE